MADEYTPGDIIYQDDPRSNSAQVVDEEGNLHGVQLVYNLAPGDVIYQENNPKSNSAQVVDSEGKLHGVQLVYLMGGNGGGDAHNKGWFATPDALREAYPTAEDGDYGIVGSTDSVWVWDSDTSDWKDTGTQPSNDYEDLTNKPQINGVTLSGNKSKADLGITDNKAIEIASNTTVSGFSVPNPTAEELTAVYNAVVAGQSVQIVDSNDVYYQVLQADSVDDAINIEILYFSEMSLLYTLENDTVSIESKKLGGGLPDQTGNTGKVLMTNGTNASWETPTTITFRTWEANE